MGRFSIRLSVYPNIHSPLWGIQPGLTGCLGLRPGWLGIKHGWLGPRPDWLGLSPVWLGLRPGWPRGGTDRQTDGWEISPFYKTLSPIGAGAQKGWVWWWKIVSLVVEKDKFGSEKG